MAFEIKHPTANNRIDGKGDRRVPGMFVAVGRARDELDVVSVLGTLDAHHGSEAAIRPTACWNCLDSDGTRHWLILFGTPTRRISEGPHTLYVRKCRANGESEEVGPIDFESNGRWGLEFIETSYPANGADISDVADYFVAYGSLSHDAVSIRLTDTTNSTNVVLSSSLYSSLEYGFWSAVFPTLVAGKTYILKAIDSNAHTSTLLSVET